MANISTKTARAKLPTGSTQHTQKISKGRFLCYRRQTDGNAGSWALRTAKATGGYTLETLGTADDLAPANGRDILTHEQAIKRAAGQTLADPTKVTVVTALSEWAEWKCQNASSPKQCTDYRNTARRIARPFGIKTLKTITAREIEVWRDSFLEDGEPQRRRATANRALANLKAALNLAAKRHSYEGPRCWREVKKFSSAESHGARMVILSSKQESQLIDAARLDAADFLTALQITGSRPGEIRQLLVGDLEGERLVISKGKTGSRAIDLSAEKAEWFRRRAGNRPKSSPLLLRQDGAAWPDDGWIKPVKRAAKAAGYPTDGDEAVTAYSLRHGFITRALSRGVPAVAVAKYVGTSVQMIEKTYAKFLPRQMAEWFA